MRLPLLSGFIIATSLAMWVPAHAQGKAGNSPGDPHAPKAGTLLRDCPDCPEMVVIPAGSFDMGSPDTEDERSNDEDPVHRVKVATFALGRTEITRGQFAAFVKKNRYSTGDQCWTLENGKFGAHVKRNWRNPGYPQNDNHPVTCINWNDAKAYAEWLSRKTGKHYRLPSEAEWEYAARGNTTAADYWGDKPGEACRYANVADLSARKLIDSAKFWSVHECSDGFAYTAPAGSFKANAFKLKDMLGNVWEWTEDTYHNSYTNSPTVSIAWQGRDTRRVLRGGSWNNGPRGVRAAKRTKEESATRFSTFGFRLARQLP